MPKILGKSQRNPRNGKPQSEPFQTFPIPLFWRTKPIHMIPPTPERRFIRLQWSARTLSEKDLLCNMSNGRPAVPQTPVRPLASYQPRDQSCCDAGNPAPAEALGDRPRRVGRASTQIDRRSHGMSAGKPVSMRLSGRCNEKGRLRRPLPGVCPRQPAICTGIALPLRMMRLRPST